MDISGCAWTSGSSRFRERTLTLLRRDGLLAVRGLCKVVSSDNLRLIRDRRSRGMIYPLPGEQLPTPEQVFAGPLQSSEHKVELDRQRNDDGCLLSDHIGALLIDALDRLDAGFREWLEMLAEEPRNRKRMQKDHLQQVFITLCKEHSLTLNV